MILSRDMEFSVTELHWAVRSNDVGLIKKLLAGGNPVQSSDSIGRTPLHWATVLGHEEALKALLLNTSRQLIDVKDKLGRTSFHYACAGGRTQFASILIKRGSSVNSKDSKGRTPLHYAAQNVKVDMVELLLKNGADKDVGDCNGVKPWDLALKWGCPDGFEILRTESAHLGSAAEPKNGSPKIENSDSRNEIRNQDFRSEKSSSLDMLLGEWKKAEATKKKREAIDGLKEALKAWREAEAEAKLANQRKSIHRSVSVGGHRNQVSFSTCFWPASSSSVQLQTVNNFILDKGSRMICFSAQPNGSLGSQALPSQFWHADEGEAKEKVDDVWGCTEWESPLRVQEMRASTGGVERWERAMEWKSRSRLPSETWKVPWFQRGNDAPASPIEAI